MQFRKANAPHSKFEACSAKNAKRVVFLRRFRHTPVYSLSSISLCKVSTVFLARHFNFQDQQPSGSITAISNG